MAERTREAEASAERDHERQAIAEEIENQRNTTYAVLEGMETAQTARSEEDSRNMDELEADK